MPKVTNDQVIRATPNFNENLIREFRDNGGKVGGIMEGRRILLLHHVGAKSGTPRVAPLVYLPDQGRYVVIASHAGLPTNPPWFHNLKANPRTKIEVGTDVIDIVASEVTGDERDQLYARLADELPRFWDYVKMTTRRIPVIVLAPTG